jgi:prophage DNA circulation protein
MSAPAGWQKGSFRGAPFVTRDHEKSGGRRLAVHELPQVDLPVLEDLGRKARRFSLNCHIIGDNYPAGADALDDALDAAGVGTLIHPWKGSMQVGVDDFSRSDSTADGGMAVFTISFVESGLPAVARAAADTASASKTVASDAAAAAPASFAERFDVTHMAGFVEDEAGKLVNAAAIATSIRAGLLGGVGPALSAFNGALGTLGLGSPILRDALSLGSATVGLVQILSSIGGSPAALFGAFGSLMLFGNDVPPVPGATPARTRQRDNQAAFIQLVNLAAATELVGTVADMSFGSYQDAVALRDGAADQLEALALRQADIGDDAGADAYDALRRALVRDVTARGATLARLQDYRPAATEPALVIAWRLYGDVSAVERQAGDIVGRNHVRHPGFVPGGQLLQVVTPPRAIGAANG